MNKSLIKRITSLVGGISLIVAGLYFILITDVKFSNSATWLFYAVITSLGSGIGFILSESISKKGFWYYFVKGLSVILVVLFMFVVYKYHLQFAVGTETFNKTLFDSIQSKSKQTTVQIVTSVKTTMLVVRILSTLGIASQIANIVLNGIFAEEE